MLQQCLLKHFKLGPKRVFILRNPRFRYLDRIALDKFLIYRQLQDIIQIQISFYLVIHRIQTRQHAVLVKNI